MKHFIQLCFILLLSLVAQDANAQLAVHIAPQRQDFLIGEQIILKLTMSNTSDQSIVLDNDDMRKWLHFTVTGANSPDGVQALASPRFPKVTMTPGSTRSFELNLKPYFNFAVPGDYKATATVRMPDKETTYSSNRAHFTLTFGSSMRSFNIQNKGRKLQLHTKLLNTSNMDCLFGQVVDMNSGLAINACYLGRYLNFISPIILLDGGQNMHALFQSTPKYYTYSVMTPDGKRAKYQIYRRTQGPLDLVVTGAGVTVVGAIPYVQANKDDGFNNVHTATDRIE